MRIPKTAEELSEYIKTLPPDERARYQKLNDIYDKATPTDQLLCRSLASIKMTQQSGVPESLAGDITILTLRLAVADTALLIYEKMLGTDDPDELITVITLNTVEMLDQRQRLASRYSNLVELLRETLNAATKNRNATAPDVSAPASPGNPPVLAVAKPSANEGGK